MAIEETIPRGLKLHNLGGIEVVAGRYRDHVLPRHSHDGLMLSLLSDGVQALHCRGVTHFADAGKILAVPPHEVHAAEPGVEGGWYYHTITIPSDVLERHHPQGARFLCETAICDDDMKRVLQTLFRSLNGAPVLAQEEALLDVLEHFLTRHTRLPQRASHKPIELRAVETCKAYLAAYLHRNVTLTELAQLARIDRFLLVRCFTNIVGIPPHAWHMQQRLHKSFEMLSKGQSVADVAAATGFADQAHLTRAFKRVTGITPGRLRKDHLAFQSQPATSRPRIAWPLPGL
jgi:AraC-like DNA-binding protein